MRSPNLAALVLGFVCVVDLAAPALAEPCGPLFVIERSVNANVVVYEAGRAGGGEIDPKDPVRAHWILRAEDGRREELTSVERQMAYGIEAVGPTGSGGVMVRLRAMPQKLIEARVVDGCPVALMTIRGKTAVLRRVFVTTEGSGLLSRVTTIDVAGSDPATRAPLEERIDVPGPFARPQAGKRARRAPAGGP